MPRTKTPCPASLPLLMVVMSIAMAVSSCTHEPDQFFFFDTGGGGGGVLIDDSLWMQPINTDPCDPGTVYFQNTAFPILFTYCASAGCHDQGTQSEEVGMFSYSSIMEQVDPGNAGNSDLWDNGINETGEDAMPPADHPQLSSAQENAIYQWIEQGALNDFCNDCDTSVVTYNAHIRPIFQNKCNGCHSGGSPAGGLDLSQWSVCNGIASTNQLEGSIKHLSIYSSMPPYPDGSYLPACDIFMLMKWKREGAPNN